MEGDKTSAGSDGQKQPSATMSMERPIVVSDKPQKKPMKQFWLLRLVSILFGAVAMAGIVVLIGVLVYLSRVEAQLPDYTVLENYQPPVTTRIHAGDGSLVGEFAKENRLFVPISEIPDTVRQAFLAAEDSGFYQHGGIDFRGIARASLANVGHYLNGRRLEGGSTITQQVAKNFLLTSDQKLERKVKEALIARRIEKAFTKDEILELYLNEIYLGLSAYGVASAALQYYDKSLDELTYAEAAYLAALPKAPNNYHPVRKRERAIARRNYVLREMEQAGYITAEERADGQAEDLLVFPRKQGTQIAAAGYFVEEVRRELYRNYGENGLYEGGLSVRTTLDPDYQRLAQRVLREGLVGYDVSHGYRGPLEQIDLDAGVSWQEALAGVEVLRDVPEWEVGVVLSTTADRAEIGLANGERGFIPLSDVAWARRVLETGGLAGEPSAMTDVVARGDVVFVEAVLGEDDRELSKDKSPTAAQISHWSLRQVPDVNGALVALDPHTGRVLAMAGGFSFAASEFNRASQAKRQPGSSFKPFVYAAALDYENGRRFTPSSLILDAPFVIDQGAGLGFWKPDNYTDQFYGPSTLRRGVEKSRNVMTVRLAQEIGMDTIMDYAYKVGIVEGIPDFKPLSMSLGAVETTLLKMTTAYSMFVNGGRRIEPTLIDRVQDRYGKTIYRHDARVCETCLMPEWDHRGEPILPDLREQVIDPRTAFQIVSILEGVVQRGTGSRVRAVGKPLAGKTGTTNEERDAWFVGFAPDLAVGVFVGFDTPKAMGRLATGGSLGAPIFRDFMQAAIGDKPAIPFRTPPGIRLVRVDPKSGKPARAGGAYIMEAFKAGTEPSGESGFDVLDGAPPEGTIYGPVGAADNPISGVRPSDDTDLDAGTGGLY